MPDALLSFPIEFADVHASIVDGEWIVSWAQQTDLGGIVYQARPSPLYVHDPTTPPDASDPLMWNAAEIVAEGTFAVIPYETDGGDFGWKMLAPDATLAELADLQTWLATTTGTQPAGLTELMDQVAADRADESAATIEIEATFLPLPNPWLYTSDTASTSLPRDELVFPAAFLTAPDDRTSAVLVFEFADGKRGIVHRNSWEWTAAGQLVVELGAGLDFDSVLYLEQTGAAGGEPTGLKFRTQPSEAVATSGWLCATALGTSTATVTTEQPPGGDLIFEFANGAQVLVDAADWSYASGALSVNLPAPGCDWSTGTILSTEQPGTTDAPVSWRSVAGW